MTDIMIADQPHELHDLPEIQTPDRDRASSGARLNLSEIVESLADHEFDVR